MEKMRVFIAIHRCNALVGMLENQTRRPEIIRQALRTREESAKLCISEAKRR
jgi:hypothetical protein